MAVTIKELLNLDIMRDFEVVAGEKGLGKSVSSTEILDFEFAEESESYRQVAFSGDSIVLSSLLFAKDRPELILSAVKKLVGLNVKALAYKPVFFKKLPDEVLEYADRAQFPIMRFGNDEFFEDVILTVKNLVGLDNRLSRAEVLFKEMLAREFTDEEAGRACEMCNALLRPNITVVCARDQEANDKRILEIIKRARPDEKLRSKTFVGKIDDRYIIILSQDEENPASLKTLYKDVTVAYGLEGRPLNIGISSCHSISDGLAQAVKEAYWSEKVGEIENKKVIYYKNLGIYKLIVSHINSDATRKYMEDYLAPLFGEYEKDGELLRTAVTYILTEGDILKTAEEMFCHKNTVRYRIGKLQEKLDPNAGEREFYMNLAAAVKIYLLVNV